MFYYQANLKVSLRVVKLLLLFPDRLNCLDKALTFVNHAYWPSKLVNVLLAQ